MALKNPIVFVTKCSISIGTNIFNVFPPLADAMQIAIWKALLVRFPK